MAASLNSDVPKKPSWETKHESTNRVARDIIDKEAALAAAKIERLRAARLEQEAVQGPAKPKAVKALAKAPVKAKSKAKAAKA